MPGKAKNTLNYQPWCVCGANKTTSCSAPYSVPEQINLQLAASDVLVVSFVTFQQALPHHPPEARWGPAAAAGTAPDDNAAAPVISKGVAHWYTTSHSAGAKRNYVMNFVRFTGLTARQKYTYSVRSGADGSQWSKNFTFRAPYGAAAGSGATPTRVAIYGDMGNSEFNNMGNLAADCESGVIDAIVHMGDHCYNMGDDDDFRGDAYMNAFSQAALASCPWMPVIGNHESTECPHDEVDESTHERYMNQTWGAAYGQADAHGFRSRRQLPSASSSPSSSTSYLNGNSLSSTATSALGHLLTKGSLLGAGVHGSKPSGTSQWYSVDLGLIHLVALDLDPLLHLAAEQQAWLEQDLAAAAANRATVPWIIVTSHFPLHNAAFEQPGVTNASASFYLGDEAEHFTTSGHDFVPCLFKEGACAEQTVGELLITWQSFMDPILQKFGVDVYDAGHVHSYDVTWPLCNGTFCGNKSYVDPNGTVHITEGNGGVPGVKGVNSIHDCKTSYGRKCGTGGAYGRFIAHNSTVLEYEHVENPTGKVSDTWAIVKSKPTPPMLL